MWTYSCCSLCVGIRLLFLVVVVVIVVFVVVEFLCSNMDTCIDVCV